MENQRQSLYFIRLTTDLLLLSISFILAFLAILPPEKLLMKVNAQFLLLSLLITWFFSARATGLYDEFRSRNFSYELIAVIKNVFILSISTIIVLFLLKERDLSRLFIIIFSSSLLVTISLKKLIFRKILEAYRKKGHNVRNLLIVGAGKVGSNFYEAIRNNPHFGYDVLGFVDDTENTMLNGKYLGKIEDLNSILSNKNVDDVVIALPNYEMEQIESVVRICENYTTRIKIIPDYFKFISSRYNVSMFGQFPVISIREDRVNILQWRFIKRTLDLVVTSLLFILVFSWLWPIIMILLKISSPGPIFFKQERWGRDNVKFQLYKFRSMRPESEDCDQDGKFKQATKNDPRVTKIGKFLRKSNLDELPQFLNVLKGQMSVVGPRPHPTPLNIESKSKINQYMLRHLVKPGITGWAQINGFRGETKDPAKMQIRIEHDIWYIENWTPLLDIQIILITIWKMFVGDPNAY